MTSRTIRRLGLVVAALAALATASSAQAVTYLQLGTSNASNATTTLTGSASVAELRVVDSNGSALTAGVLGLLTATSPTVASAALKGQNNATNGRGYGVYGSHAGSGIGVNGFSPRGMGVRGQSTSGIGVLGGTTLGGTGVYGTSPYGRGVYGTSPGGNGVEGSSSSGYGVSGTSPSGLGVYGTSSSGLGVYGSSSGGAGVEGSSLSSYGVYGSSVSGTKGGVAGVSGGGDAIRGISYATNFAGIYGENALGATNAAYFAGHVYIGGGCTGCAGPSLLQIDDPLDPAHKYLQHSSVASSQQLDVYSGNVSTNGKGFATVQMPRWFQALNRSFRYQLTVVGRAHWEAKAAVWNEMRHNRFTIRTDQPKVKVSWLVTGIRQDRYANANPTQVIVPKPKADQGKYVHPELFGKPRSDVIGYQKPPAITRRSVQTP